MSVIIRFENAIFTGLYLIAQRIVQDGKNQSISVLNSFHLPNRTQKGTSITQLRVVTNQYYIITLMKNFNPENKSMICKQIFHTCSRFLGCLYFMHLICILSLMFTGLRSHPSSFYNIFLLLIQKKNTHKCKKPEAEKENFTP